ncbi:MAG: S8 family serine peptidase [Planctomycetota bacterium]|nr:S8 family serine peptidase [Planctomycetota bacterium]
MDAPKAWDVTTGDPNIPVLIMDTGVQQNHPDINQIAGEDFTGQGGGGGPVNECDNHGTPVAGCVSSIIDNNLGTVGVAPGSRVASARIFISNNSCNGSWSAQFSWGVDALAWAEAMGVRVTNNSNYYGGTSSALEDKYDQTRNNGMIHFASAGNNSSSNITYPANLSTVNAIAALDDDGNLAPFSNWGTGLAFSAPGLDIVTTDRTGSDGWVEGDYVCAWGTSFASPYSAGVAALVLSVESSLDAFDVEQVMQESSVDLGAPGYDTIFGWGFVNAHQAILEVPPPCPWDLDDSGDVGVKDMLFLLGTWGPCPKKGDCPADFDGDGSVGVKDLLILLGNWGPCP